MTFWKKKNFQKKKWLFCSEKTKIEENDFFEKKNDLFFGQNKKRAEKIFFWRKLKKTAV